MAYYATGSGPQQTALSAADTATLVAYCQANVKNCTTKQQYADAANASQQVANPDPSAAVSMPRLPETDLAAFLVQRGPNVDLIPDGDATQIATLNGVAVTRGWFKTEYQSELDRLEKAAQGGLDLIDENAAMQGLLALVVAANIGVQSADVATLLALGTASAPLTTVTAIGWAAYPGHLSQSYWIEAADVPDSLAAH